MNSGQHFLAAIARLALISAPIVAVVVVLYMPTGRGEPAVGRVDTMGFWDTDTGTRLVVRVTVGASQVSLSLPQGAICSAGDRISLVKRRTLLSVRYTMGRGGCARPGSR